MAPAPIRLLVVDDDPAVRAAYRAMFEPHPELTLVGELADGADAVAGYERLRPDVVLMDLQLPRISGVEATRALCGRWPDAVVVVMTTFSSREHVVAALRAGASGYLVKGVAVGGLVVALRQAIAGDMPLSAAVRRELVASLGTGQPVRGHTLTAREVELVGRLAHGLSNAQIARRMHLSEGSVKQYVARIGDKLGVRARTQILIRAIQLGIVDPDALPPTTR